MRPERINELNGKPETTGSHVLYWMQAAVRPESNFALDWAVRRANELKLPLLACFCLTDSYPMASPTHYRYLLEGLEEARIGLAAKGVALITLRGTPDELIGRAASQAALVVCDTGYSRTQRNWLAALIKTVPCRFVRIEGDVIVPPLVSSSKEEWSAYTLRRKMTPMLDIFLEATDEVVPKKTSLPPDASALFPGAGALVVVVGTLAAGFSLPGIAPVRAKEQQLHEKSGFRAASDSFEEFLSKRLESYDRDRNDPCLDGSSRMSAALHFGHISPTALVRRALRASGESSAEACTHPGLKAYIEELAIRRELAINFVIHRDDYDSPSCLPDWAVRTLDSAVIHPRAAIYTFAEFEAARTHDPYWNAAQDQMVKTGRMHGYMRMYWGKQILGWSASAEEAYRTAVRLNDCYSLDGRDPNGWAGVAWCFGKHDRPWTGRPVFGTVRYMNAAGLKRKFDADAYVRMVASL